MTAELKVADCRECPLFHSDEYGERCEHPDGARRHPHHIRGHWIGQEHQFIPAATPAPDWCPLRLAPLTIKLVAAK